MRSAQVRFASRSRKSRPRSSSICSSATRRAVDLRQARANHRHELRRRALARSAKNSRIACGLIRPDVDHEMIRRVLRQARAPLLHQVVAHDREQQQHHQPEAERDDLNDAVAAAPRDVRHAVAPGDTDAAAQTRPGCAPAASPRAISTANVPSVAAEHVAAAAWDRAPASASSAISAASAVP